MLTQIFNSVLLNGHIPNEWVIGIIQPVYKIKVTLLIQITTEGQDSLAAWGNDLLQL